MTPSATCDAALVRDARRIAAALALPQREARLEAELLLAHALGITRAQLIARPERAADALPTGRYPEYLERRLGGEPVAYIVGEREFYGLSFQVAPAVLIPRPETELLVEMALQRIEPAASARVLDMGTGSGCIALSIARLRSNAQVVATDVSPAALTVAEANALRHRATNVEFRLGDCYAALADAQFDLIVANPPYVAEGDPHLNQGDVRFEPWRALVSGADGLALTRRLVAQAPGHLRAGAWLLVEHGHDQAGPVRELFEAAGFGDFCCARDLAGLPRAAAGRLTLKP
ncbi:MAG TPA: peptide chain release factor N(5)-glutamine methyltransferase [Burkholderiales bacterium]|jgi:release factor glutamine methyltransferase